MPSLTHIFFDLHGTLIDGDALHPCYSASMGRIIAGRYGGDAQAWAAANSHIVADWDSYFADLNLDGDDSLDEYREGLYRITRAMFRLMTVPEPPKSELADLAWELPGLVTRDCDAAYPDVRAVIADLHAGGYILGVTSHAVIAQARGLLRGAGLADYFAGVFVGPDNAARFIKDAGFYRLALALAEIDPAACAVVEDRSRYIAPIKSTGMRAIQIRRDNADFSPHADATLRGDLSGLRDCLQGL